MLQLGTIVPVVLGLDHQRIHRRRLDISGDFELVSEDLPPENDMPAMLRDRSMAVSPARCSDDQLTSIRSGGHSPQVPKLSPVLEISILLGYRNRCVPDSPESL